VPTAPPRPCVHRGCPRLQPCPNHARRQRPSSTTRRLREPGKRLYDRRAWRAARKAYLAQHALCVACEAQGRMCLATDVDHIEPHKGDRDKFWRRENWQALCAMHHGQKTRREMRSDGA
jgi:5-methylcytosine-specific restriction protein A